MRDVVALRLPERDVSAGSPNSTKKKSASKKSSSPQRTFYSAVMKTIRRRRKDDPEPKKAPAAAAAVLRRDDDDDEYSLASLATSSTAERHPIRRSRTALKSPTHLTHLSPTHLTFFSRNLSEDFKGMKLDEKKRAFFLDSDYGQFVVIDA
mmetsp:Transcript_11827/g.35516  ORF Transcript_11827/g.35516 Transcript_11827/m.35516 type:complete len:151 (-) Transcript_11827:181-633(-)